MALGRCAAKHDSFLRWFDMALKYKKYRLGIFRALLGLVIAGLGGLYLLLRITAPVNYLATDPAQEALGWTLREVAVKQVDIPAPVPGAPVQEVTGLSEDSAMTLWSRVLPPGSATFSVYLRAPERTTIKIHLGGTKTVLKIARLTPQWQRFDLVAPEFGGGHGTAWIGGSGSLTKGEIVYVCAPQLQSGTEAKPYTSVYTASLTWFDWIAEEHELRWNEPSILWGAVLAAIVLALTFASARAAFVNAVKGFFRACRRIYGHPNRIARTIISYAAIVAGTIVAIEVASFVACVVLMAQSTSVAEAAKSVWLRGWVKNVADVRDPSNSTFSPLTQIRRIVPKDGYAEDARLPYRINRLGLIDNEGATEALDVMPEKPAGMIRIIVYGGSTAMGIGARDGTETLTAQIERLLNAKAKDGTVFQVLNFGQGGGQSFTDLQFMSSMGVYLDPDVSILLNGFNDAFGATESAIETKGQPYIINWATYSYHFDNLVNGVIPAPPVSISFLPFSSLLVSAFIVNEQASRKAIDDYYDAMPMRLVSEWVDRTHGRPYLLLQNLRFTAGYFVGRSDEVLLSYLQPHPLQFRKLLTTASGPVATEQQQVESWIARGQRYDPAEYKKRMIAMFNAYGDVYKTLNQEYGKYPNIRFYDIRDAFQDFPRPAYQDIIHYTPAGQRYLAERMYRDLMKVDVIRMHSRD